MSKTAANQSDVDEGTARDVVATRAEAALLSRPPLIVRDALEGFLDQRGLGHGEVEVERIGAGISNVIYRVTRAGFNGVLRRPPRPPFPARAHDVLREVRMLDALAGTGARVPPVIAACEDLSVLGVPFYLMPHFDGPVLANSMALELDTEPNRRAVGRDFVIALAELHSVDVAAPAFEAFHRPGTYSERQLKIYGRLWADAPHRAIPVADEVQKLLLDRLPTPSVRTVVHGDYRLGNVVFAPLGQPRIEAILDWESAAIGDPTSDLGYMVATWPEPGDDRGVLIDFARFATAPGFPNRAQLIDIYEQAVGRSVGDLGWYVALANWRTAVALEGFYQSRKDSDDDRAAVDRLREGVPALFERARDALTQSSAGA